MKKNSEEYLDPEVTQSPTIDLNVLEIRGRGKKWNLSYPDPSNISSPTPVFRDGEPVEVVYSQVATNKMVDVHEIFTSEEAAREAANFIKPGCEIKVVKIQPRRKRKKK